MFWSVFPAGRRSAALPMSSPVPVPVFVGYDPHERAAVNVLIDSLYQHSSLPLAITPIVASQLTDVFTRERNPKQSTEFSFTRFLVPYLMGYQGWAVFMDCDMLCRGDLAELWACRDDRHALMVVKHSHEPEETVKFLGAVQTRYARKNWSSLMLFNCSRCTALTPDYVNTATGLSLHRFAWLDDDAIGALPAERWNHLIDVQEAPSLAPEQGGPLLVHWTKGGPWFRDYRHAGAALAAEWFASRDAAFRLWD
jgi:lipopolysaccharide biosynthesis glycosyltransferase